MIKIVRKEHLISINLNQKINMSGTFYFLFLREATKCRVGMDTMGLALRRLSLLIANPRPHALQ